MKELKTTIICVGGYGTRFLTFTKYISKEMLPIDGVPAIGLVVEECLNVAFEKIIIVTRYDTDILKEHFSDNIKLEKYLIKHNK